MMPTDTKTVLFDPGFAQHTTILSISVPYIYDQINKFKNMGQRKMKFKMTFPNLIKMSDNNIGFCLGCMLWAVYLKKQNAQIQGNPCLGSTFDKDETVEEIDYSIEFLNKLKKDSKYYLGTDYEINPKHIKILDLYKKFLLINKNFINTKTTDDIVLPEEFKIPTQNDLDKIYSKIQEVIKSGNLLDLEEVFGLVYEL